MCAMYAYGIIFPSGCYFYVVRLLNLWVIWLNTDFYYLMMKQYAFQLETFLAIWIKEAMYVMPLIKAEVSSMETCYSVKRLPYVCVYSEIMLY